MLILFNNFHQKDILLTKESFYKIKSTINRVINNRIVDKINRFD